jgi:hypothetical protein
MPFDQFTNPFRDPAYIPTKYRQYTLLHGISFPDRSYRRRAEVRRLRSEAERIVTETKAIVERMILGEEAP